MNVPSKQQLAKARVLVVGDAMLDRYWHGAVDRISPEAPVPVCQGGARGRADRRGGQRRLQRGHAGRAGDVPGGGRRRRARPPAGGPVAATGIDAHLKRDPGLRTTVKLRVIGRHQQLLRMDFESEPDHEALASQTEAFAQLLPQHDAVLFSDYGKGGLAHITAMIDQARSAHKAVLIDPKGSDYLRYAGATVITPNRSELQQVVGAWRNDDELAAKARQLRESLRLDALLVTLGEDGMTLFDAQGQSHVQAQAREVFDVTGAGDTVIATLAALVAAGLAPREAMPLANKAGGIVVGKFGTATVSYEELFS